jgi:hypothetical protein
VSHLRITNTYESSSVRSKGFWGHKRERLTPTIILLILSMLVGFSMLNKLSKPSVLVAAVLGLVVIGSRLSFLSKP